MNQRVKTLICLLLAVCCLIAGGEIALAAGGHAYETEVPPDLAAEVPAVESAEEQTIEPTETTEPEAPEESNGETSVPQESEEEGQTEEPDITPVPWAKTPKPLREAEVTEQPTETETPAETELPTETEAPAETETAIPQGNNQDDVFELNLTTGEEQVDPNAYVCAMHVRPEAYHPASVLISGVLYASADTEILEATVSVNGGEPHVIPGPEILRTRSGSEPASVAQLTFEPDRERSVFAFLADLSGEQLPDGPTPITVTLTTDSLLTLTTTVELNAELGQYYHVTRAIRGQCLSLDDRDQDDKHVTRFQQKLADLGYLKGDELSGVFDEKTLNAARELLDKYQKNAGNEYLSPEEVGFVLYGESEAKSTNADGFFDKVMAFLRNKITLFGLAMPGWMLTAAGAAILLLILIVILLIAGRKKKARRREKEASTMNELSRRSAFITGQEEAEQASQILTIGDEPTMDLAEAEAGGGLVYSGDEPTTDLNTPIYIIKMRLIYSGQYMDTSIRLQEGGEAAIGRGEGVQIQTNSADTSVSHRHGVFSINGGMVTYTDNSRNGSRFNAQRTLHKGETVNIPFNTKVQLEIGNHKVLVITGKENE